MKHAKYTPFILLATKAFKSHKYISPSIESKSRNINVFVQPNVWRMKLKGLKEANLHKKRFVIPEDNVSLTRGYNIP